MLRFWKLCIMRGYRPFDLRNEWVVPMISVFVLPPAIHYSLFLHIFTHYHQLQSFTCQGYSPRTRVQNSFGESILQYNVKNYAAPEASAGFLEQGTLKPYWAMKTFRQDEVSMNSLLHIIPDYYLLFPVFLPYCWSLPIINCVIRGNDEFIIKFCYILLQCLKR